VSCWESRDAFRERVREWAGRLDVDVRSITIRPMRRKWASCSTSGRLSFNDELIGLDRETGDYVIVHELLHAHLGNYEAIEEAAQADAGDPAYVGPDPVSSRYPPGRHDKAASRPLHMDFWHSGKVANHARRGSLDVLDIAGRTAKAATMPE
jgi:hypothetical protein